ncbi:MAG: DedA family protein [Bacteroidetes bacterium]|nr:DedA family protein [Bacteroidota bacterium]
MELIDFILHIDKHLKEFIELYPTLVYGILFAIIFIETGLVVMPLLPGDSLLFAIGMFSAQGMLNLPFTIILLIIAAFTGDTVNYFIGKFFSSRILGWKLFGKTLVKQEHLDKTHAFYEKHGPKTIILARFVPIVRTFAPFVAGVGTMSYKTFLSYNIIGGIIWVVGVTLAGYFLGEIPWIKDNFEKVIFLIIGISVLPIIFGYLKGRKKG